MKEGSFTSLSTADKALESSKVLLPVLAGNVNVSFGTFVDLLTNILPDSKKNFESNLIPLKDSKKVADKFNNDSK